MELIVKFALLLLSMLGYFLWFSKEYRIRFELMPAIFCAGVSNVLFLAGVLNLLQEAAFVIFILGYGLLIKCLRKQCWKDIWSLAFFGIFAACIGYFCLYFRGMQVTSYDDFSHWALVVRSMLLTEGMPKEGSLVGFQSYPLGSALFIYYICNILGSTEACFLWAQLVLTMSLILSVCAVIDRKHIAYALAIPFFVVYSLVMNASIQMLIVDTLLSVGAIAGFAAVLSVKDRPKLAMVLLGLFSAFLTNTKNSGMFFAIALIALYVWLNGKPALRMHKQFTTFCLLPTFFTWLIWSRHVDLVFSSAHWSKHAMNVERFGAVAAEKTPEIYRQILTLQAENFFSFNDITIRMLLISAVGTLVLCLLCKRRKEIKRHVAWFGMLALITLAYQIGIAAMYIFSMPTREALRLASYGRYERSLALFVLGAHLLYMIKAFVKMELKGVWRAVSLCMVLVLVCSPLYGRRTKISTLYTKSDYTQTERYRLQQIKKHAGMEAGKNVLIYRKEKDSDYLRHVCMYEFFNGQCAVVNSMEEFIDLMSEYAYAVLWDPDDSQLTCLQENGYAYETAYDAIVVKNVQSEA